MPKKGNSSAFKAKWELEYGIRVTCQDAATSDPVTAICLFCQTFGKDAPDDEET